MTNTQHTDQCSLCKQGADYEKELTHVQMARKYGVSEGSVRRHRKYLRQAVQPEDPFLKELGIDASTVTARGYTRRLEDGSYEKVTWKPAKAAMEQALSYDDISHLFDGVVSKPLPAESRHTEVLCMSDLQIGKVDKRGGTPETLKAIRVSLDAFAERCSESKPETILIIDGGDPIENIFNTGQQKYTNDLDLVSQIRTARRVFAEAIRDAASLAPNVIFLSVPSNHGAARAGYKEQAGSTDADFGLDINHALEEQFTGRPDFEHVRFVRPNPLEETAEVKVSGTKIAVHHGHHTGGPLKHGDWWARQDHGRRPGWDADILVMSHFHTFNIGHSGNGRWIISCSSSDNGSLWFTNKTGEESIAGMTAFAVADGRWSHAEIV
jgi:hypothetical protein